MTKKSKRTQLVFWLIIIGLLISMLIAFTPTLNGLFGGGQQNQQRGNPAILVNGEPVYDLEVAQLQQQQPFNMGFQGEVGDDLNLLLADSLISQKLLNQAASKERVTDAEVRERLNAFRAERGLEGASNDAAYLNLISGAGYTDATFRDALRDQLRFERYQENLTKDVSVSDEEVAAFYELTKDSYQSEEKIEARQIVVSDGAKADELLAKAQAGEDFGTLAKDNSEELADRNGALGAASGSTEALPVGPAALPGAVSQAAFALQGTGLTDVIAANEKFYIVSVEEFLPSAQRPLEEVTEEVKTAALEVKKQGVLESSFEEMRNNAKIEIPEGSTVVYNNPAVAKVGDVEIKSAELANAVYGSQQIQQSLQPGMEQIIGLFKGSYLEQLINREVAYQGSKTLEGATFFGGKSQIAQQAQLFVSKDAATTPEDLQKFYDENLETRFTIPASAVANRIDFTTQEAATAFRTAMTEGGVLQEVAEANGGIVTDLGTVQAGSLPTELDTALFGTDAFDPLPDSEETISDILVVQEPVEPATPEETDTDQGATATAETTEPETTDVYVVLVGTRTPETVQPFEEVQEQVEQEVLAQKRSELSQAWLEEVKATVPVENLLPEPTPPAAPEPTFETTPLPEIPTEEVPADGAATPTEETPATEESTSEETPTEETPATDATSAEETPTETTDEVTTEETATEEPSTEEPATTEEAPAETTDTSEPASTTEEPSSETSSTTEETTTEETTTEETTTEETTTEEAAPAEETSTPEETTGEESATESQDAGTTENNTEEPATTESAEEPAGEESTQDSTSDEPAEENNDAETTDNSGTSN
jgi:parvulin-like peptidyl-prolyl isomerase